MAPGKVSKWIVQASPDDRTCDVAQRTLEERLAVVQRYLPLAAQQSDEDPEYVHKLRVATRRAGIALQLFAGLLPRRSRDWLRKTLKRIRRAVGEARDLDVMVQRVKEKHADVKTDGVLDQLRDRRNQAQDQIRKIYERVTRDDRLAQRVEKVLGNVRVRPNGGVDRLFDWRFGNWARRRLRPFVEQLFEAVPPPEAPVEALHRLRISGKKLRYVMEVLAGAFSASFRKRLYPLVETLQEKLGNINDHAVGMDRLRQRLDSAAGAEEETHLRTLIDREARELERTRSDFFDWWTRERQLEVRGRFEQALEGRREPVLA